jgi:branched-chain amino acid transport system ATP-binding protein
VLHRGLVYVTQGRIVFPEMTVLENLEMGVYIERESRRVREALERVYELFPILAERRRQRAGTMSGGEQQMVAIGRALMTSPKLVRRTSPRWAGAEVRVPHLRAAGRDEARGLHPDGGGAERGAGARRGRPRLVLELGQNRFEGTGMSLLADPEVKRLYLGG